MSVEWIRTHCLSFPHATESVQWGDNLVFKIAGKMFAVAALEPSKVCLSFKCSKEGFAELIEREGVIPAPYLARASWVGLEREDALPRAEIKALLKQAYQLVSEALPARQREELRSLRKNGH